MVDFEVPHSQSRLSRPARSASWSCRNRGDLVWGLGGGFYSPGASSGFDSAVRFAHVLAQPALSFLKLVEPACERQRVGRVETVVGVSGVLGSGLTTGCRWWFRLSRSLRSRAGSTSFGEGGFTSRLNQLRKRGIFSNCPIRMSRAYLIPHRKALMGPSPRSCRKNGASSLDPAAIDNRVGRPARPRRVVPRVPARPSGSFSQQPRYR